MFVETCGISCNLDGCISWCELCIICVYKTNPIEQWCVTVKLKIMILFTLIGEYILSPYADMCSVRTFPSFHGGNLLDGHACLKAMCFYWLLKGLRGIYQRGQRAERPRGSHPRVPQWIGLKELCSAVYTAAGPLCLCGGPAAGARRYHSWSDSSAVPAGIGSVDWSVFIDQRSSAAKWGSSNCVRTRASVNTRPARKTLPAPTGGFALRWCKCALRETGLPV